MGAYLIQTEGRLSVYKRAVFQRDEDVSGKAELYRIPGTRIFVDYFEEPADMHFLTHYHFDHMRNLDKDWDLGTIMTGPVTAKALIALKKIPAERIYVIEAGSEIKINSGGKDIYVRAYEANHCPGSLMFKFEIDGGSNILHTGDFRYSPEMAKVDFGKVDLLYLDATYDVPRYTFPPAEDVLSNTLDFIQRYDEMTQHPRPPIFIATYTFGKEEYMEGIYKRLGTKVYATKWRLESYRLLDYDQDALTGDAAEAGCKAYARNYFDTHFKKTSFYRSIRRLVVIPTGWALDNANNDDGYHYFPDSDHCDYNELCRFVKHVGPGKIIKTHSLREVL